MKITQENYLQILEQHGFRSSRQYEMILITENLREIVVRFEHVDIASGIDLYKTW